MYKKMIGYEIMCYEAICDDIEGCVRWVEGLCVLLTLE